MDNIDEGGLIHELAQSGKTIVFYCAFGERSAMAVQAAQDKGLCLGPAHRRRHGGLDEGLGHGAVRRILPRQRLTGHPCGWPILLHGVARRDGRAAQVVPVFWTNSICFFTGSKAAVKI